LYTNNSFNHSKKELNHSQLNLQNIPEHPYKFLSLSSIHYFRALAKWINNSHCWLELRSIPSTKKGNF